MKDRVFQTMDKAYYALFDEVKNEGQQFKPRARDDTVEIRPYSFTITDPLRTLYRGYSRKCFYRFYAIETLGYLGGLDQAWYGRFLAQINKQFSKYLDSKGNLYGAYGPRIMGSLFDVLDILYNDPDARHAVCSIWAPEIPKHPNLMCTLSLQFFTEFIDGERVLSLQVNMRSNDLNWGVPYDVPAFCALLAVMASCLYYPVGRYYHNTGSMHFYTREEMYPKVVSRLEEKWMPLNIVVPSIAQEEHESQIPRVRLIRLVREAGHFVYDIKVQKWGMKKWGELQIPRGTDYPEYWYKWLRLIRFQWKDHEHKLKLGRDVIKDTPPIG